MGFGSGTAQALGGAAVAGLQDMATGGGGGVGACVWAAVADYEPSAKMLAAQALPVHAGQLLLGLPPAEGAAQGFPSCGAMLLRAEAMNLT